LLVLSSHIEWVMFRTAAVALVALAAFDYFYLDGKYIHSVQMAVLSILHFVVG
jgi:hypothetical protein